MSFELLQSCTKDVHRPFLIVEHLLAAACAGNGDCHLRPQPDTLSSPEACAANTCWLEYNPTIMPTVARFREPEAHCSDKQGRGGGAIVLMLEDDVLSMQLL
jgi:hypothetical protein